MDERDELEPVLLAETALPSAWAFGPYKKGMGKPGSHYRERVAVVAVKRELRRTHGYDDINLLSTVFGSAADKAARDFQKLNGLKVDGLVGKKTANALWRKRIGNLGIPNGWLRALVHWESLDDPGAEFTNSDGSLDRGLVMLNSTRKPLSMDEAFDPGEALDYAATYLSQRAGDLVGCHEAAPSRWHLAVGSWRTPVGARDWCLLGEVNPDPNGTWAQRAAHYVMKVDTAGRADWINPPQGVEGPDPIVIHDTMADEDKSE